MPIGFPAYTEKSERYRGVDRKTLMRAALDALDDLKWRPDKDGKWAIRASVPIGLYIIFLTLGAKFTVEVEDERLHMRSEGSFPLEWLDVGQHAENIKMFLKRLDDCLGVDDKEHDKEDGREDRQDKRRKDKNEDDDDTAIKDSKRRKVDDDQDQDDDSEDRVQEKPKADKKRKDDRRPKDGEED